MGDVILEVKQLRKWFPAKTRLLERGGGKYVKAVDGIDFSVEKSEVFGLIGESGCGKTTTGKLVLGLIDRTTGSVLFRNEEVFSMKSVRLKELRRTMQVVFQNPYESLEPRLTVFNLLSEPLALHKMAETEAIMSARIREVLAEVDIDEPDAVLCKHPFELSGGQLQRIAIARALILHPEFLVADEPVSMVDLSIRAGILKLLLKLRDRLGLTILFITHDLAVSKFVCDRVAVMYLGKIVEIGPSQEVLDGPLHPYTRALRAAIPSLDPSQSYYRSSDAIGGEVGNAIDIPSGCRFRSRCPYARERCRNIEPQLRELKKDHYVACFCPEDLPGNS